MNYQKNAKTHELKTWPDYFDAVLEGRKPFELREDDRGYLVGDTLHLREWNPDTQAYTGRECYRLVTFTLRPDVLTEATIGVRRGYVVLGTSTWTSVSVEHPAALPDTLGEYSEDVLVAVDGQTLAAPHNYYWSPGLWYPRGHSQPTLGITHWQPLPYAPAP